MTGDNMSTWNTDLEISQQYRAEWEVWRTGGQGSCAKHVYPLATKVLVVAVWRIDGWKAYCNAVPGKNHHIEFASVAYEGTPIDEYIARAIFPMYKDIPYAR